MKKIALFLMAAFAVIACEEKFVPQVDYAPAEVTIPAAGTDALAEPVTFAFEANAAWTASLTGEGVSEWLSITPKSGEAGEASIKFTAAANDAKENRTATLEIVLEGLDPVLVTVTQLQTNAIDISGESAYTLSFEGETVEIEVGHNVEYSYELTGGEWLVETKAYETDKLVFTAPAQEINAASRTATLDIYSVHDGIKGHLKTITITQEAWTVAATWTKSLSEMGVPAGRVGVTSVGDKVYFAAAGEIWVIDEATGDNAQKITLPEGFVAGSVLADDAGNLMVSGPNVVYELGGQLQLYKVDPTSLTPELLIDYNVLNAYCTAMGNFRVKGDITKNAVITAYLAGGNANTACLVWEVKEGALESPKYIGGLPDYSWAAETGVVAPAGDTFADGLFFIAYGANYNLHYYDGATWTVSYTTGAEWDENHNCISIAEVNDKVYLARVTGSFAESHLSNISILNVTDPKAAVKLYSIELNTRTANAAGFQCSDVYVRGENGNLAAYVIDPWMDVIEKYVFPL